MPNLFYSWSDQIFEPSIGEQIVRWILELPGSGCAWYKKTGGCTMCGFSKETQKYTFGGKLMPPWWFHLLIKIGWISVKKSNPKALYIYNGGNFFNPQEIPPATQQFIASLVTKQPTLIKLFVESRPEYITTDSIKQIKENLGEKELQIGVGFETQDDNIRNKVLKKGITKSAYRKAIETAQQNGTKTLTYVFLKPHGLTEIQAIEETIETIKYCFQVGTDEISLSCAFVQPGTILEKKWKAGQFTPPSLKTILTVIKNTKDMGPVRIGTFADSPPPLAVPQGTKEEKQKIIKYRSSHNLV